MICRGNQFKWIATEEYFATGEMVFIDPPDEAPHSIDKLDCTYVYLAEQYTDNPELPVQVDKVLLTKQKH